MPGQRVMGRLAGNHRETPGTQVTSGSNRGLNKQLLLLYTLKLGSLNVIHFPFGLF